MPGAIVIGAGPGIGTSVARRFAGAGLPVAVLARSRETVDTALAALADAPAESLGLTADVTDEWALRTALDEAVARLGVPDVLVYNAALIQSDGVGDLSAEQHLDAWAVNVVGAITAVAHLGPAMARAGHGTILLTGGMPEPLPDVTSLSLGKAGVRALADLLARAYEPLGVHVATITVAGAVAPAPPSIPTRSLRSTGGSTSNDRGRGSARSSTPGGPRASRRARTWRRRAERRGGAAARCLLRAAAEHGPPPPPATEP